MRRGSSLLHIAAAAAAAFATARVFAADSASCDLGAYTSASGLTATNGQDGLTLAWDGEKDQQLRLRLAINAGTPTIRDLAVRRKNGQRVEQWATLASNVTPEYRVVSGLRRMTNQQLEPLRGLKVELTPEVVDKYKWDAFWDAPLNLDPPPGRGGGNPPPAAGVANQPGLPRKPEEIRRADAVYQSTGCSVKTNGSRIEVSFPGVQLGVFAGRLQYTVYKGTNLIRQEVIAKTDQGSVAYKYDAGLKGLAVQPASHVVWRDLSRAWQDYDFGAPDPSTSSGSSRATSRDDKARPASDGTMDAVPLRTSNRLVAAQWANGSIAAFPAPHNFFWSREIDTVLGYNYYRRDGASSFSIGVRQPDSEDDPAAANRGGADYRQNFALYSARPGTWQKMAVYFYVSPDAGQAAIQGAFAFTREDHYKPLPGYEVMATHYHTGFLNRLRSAGSLDAPLPDLIPIKAAGINIMAPIDGGSGAGGGRGRPEQRLKDQADWYTLTKNHSERGFVIMPDEEVFNSPLGGHTDLLLSHPVYWTNDRTEGQPLVEKDPVRGNVYHLGSGADMIEMGKRENILIFMPHPRSKGSTGYPDAIKDLPEFQDDTWRGIGVRWGMGLDGSEQRLCDYRCWPLLDDMNNWVAKLPVPPKFVQAISEVYQQGPGDDIYANTPVNYVKLAAVPGPDDTSPIVNAMRRGDYFVSSGEVLIPSYSVQGSGNTRTIVADVEWTFPLEFAEVVWGDGKTTNRQVIPATDLPAFGKKHFEIPFNAEGKAWVRFAVWDSAGNGAVVQPVKLTSVATTAQVGLR